MRKVCFSRRRPSQMMATNEQTQSECVWCVYTVHHNISMADNNTRPSTVQIKKSGRFLYLLCKAGKMR
jgi:hypothetical protein